MPAGRTSLGQRRFFLGRVYQGGSCGAPTWYLAQCRCHGTTQTEAVLWRDSEAIAWRDWDVTATN